MTDTTPAAPKPQESIKRLAFRGSAWTILGYSFKQVLRFGANIVLTRLLFPEAFGMMALVNVYIQGIHMFSDLGIAPSVIQNPRGADPEFLRTAWTVQVLRGFLIWFCATLMALPLAGVYDEPMLRVLLVAAAGTAVISGLNSPVLFLLNRRLSLGSLTILEVVNQIITITTVIVWAYLSPSVWALVAGSYAGTTVAMLASHFAFKGPRMRFLWEKEAAHELIHFGKWIFVSSVLGFMATRLDRIVLGRVMDMAELGVYSIAYMLAQVPIDVINSLKSKILFPLYSRFARESSDSLRRKTLKVRAVLMLLGSAPLLILIFTGPWLVQIVYPDQYADAGWIVQILAVGGVVALIRTTSANVMLAHGNSFRFMTVQACQTTILIASMIVGGHLYGAIGLICAIPAAEFLFYPIVSWGVFKYKVWLPVLDMSLIIVVSLCAAGVYWMQSHDVYNSAFVDNIEQVVGSFFTRLRDLK